MDPTAKDVGCGADDEAERHAERHGPCRHEKEHGNEDELRRDRAARSDLELDPRGERIGQEDRSPSDSHESARAAAGGSTTSTSTRSKSASRAARSPVEEPRSALALLGGSARGVSRGYSCGREKPKPGILASGGLSVIRVIEPSGTITSYGGSPGSGCGRRVTRPNPGSGAIDSRV